MSFATLTAPPLAAAAVLMSTAGSAPAAVASRFDCSGPGVSITLSIEAETGTATLLSPRGTDELSPESAGVWRDDTQELQFFADEAPPTLWMGPEQFTCRTVALDN